MKYPQGTKFIRRGDRHKRILTVFDYHTTRNISGDIVKQRYCVGYNRNLVLSYNQVTINQFPPRTKQQPKINKYAKPNRSS